MQPFCVTRNIFHFSLKTVVDSWNHISIFSLSTLELDNALHILSFAGLWIVNSAKVSYGVATNIRNWLQIGYNFETYKKESPVSHWPTGLFLRRFRMGLNLNVWNQEKLSEIIRNLISSSYELNSKRFQVLNIHWIAKIGCKLGATFRSFLYLCTQFNKYLLWHSFF